MLDDVLERMKPSLLKHTGCDIIDINPGAGVWSSALHDLLKPRNHYLMEPDHELYTPLLQPLLDAEASTYKLIPKSGAIWGQLNNLLSPATLPDQVEYEAGDHRLDKPNDTLLVTANLGWHPRKSFRAFPSVSLLVIHQLLSAVRAHSLFHRYGLIRMLIWVSNEDGKMVLPRNINQRRKMAIEAEISCHGIYEVASSTIENPWFRRDEDINVESFHKVLKRMEDTGITTPEGREGPYQLQATKKPQQQETQLDGVAIRRKWQDEWRELQERFAAGQFPKFTDAVIPANRKPKLRRVLSPEWQRLRDLRWFFENKKKQGKEVKKGKRLAELEDLEARFQTGGFQRYLDLDPDSKTPSITKSAGQKSSTKHPDEAIPSTKGRTARKLTEEYKRMKKLESRVNVVITKGEQAAPLFVEFEEISTMEMQLQKLEGRPAEALKREIDDRVAGFQEQIESLSKNDSENFWNRLDNRRTFYNEPPLLYWDKREAEPLKVKPEEFYPNNELCLLDFHPAPLWPVLRQDFPATYDVFEYILSSMYITPTQSVKSALTAVSPGALEWLEAECPSLKDTSKGGNPNLDFLNVRCLTLEMLKEIMEAWMRWPWRPDRFELMKMSGSTPYDPDEEPAD